MSGMALGNERFKNELATLTGRRLHPYLQAENRDGVKANSFNVVLTPDVYFTIIFERNFQLPGKNLPLLYGLLSS